jgi:hypothetical protein
MQQTNRKQETLLPRRAEAACGKTSPADTSPGVVFNNKARPARPRVVARVNGIANHARPPMR